MFGLVLLDEISMYSTGKLIGVFAGAIVSIIGVMVLAMKNGNVLKQQALAMT